MNNLEIAVVLLGLVFTAGCGLGLLYCRKNAYISDREKRYIRASGAMKGRAADVRFK